MTQASLFDHGVPLCSPRPDLDICFNKHGGAETSTIAHDRVNKERDRQLVYGYIKAAGQYGMTVDEMSIQLDRAPNRLSGRFSELKRAGEIVASGLTRPTRTGSPAKVYVVTG